MPKISFNRLVIETSQRLYGLSALIELVYPASLEVEQQERAALKQLAETEHWDFGDYSVEDQFLDVKFRYGLPKSAGYCVVILLSSIVETQLLSYAKRVAEQKGSAFDRSDFRSAILAKVAEYIKQESGLDLTQNNRWTVLTDLQALRNIIVHRDGMPDEDEQDKVRQICKRRPGVSLVDMKPYTIWGDHEIGITVHSCRYFASEVEEFFKGLFKDAGFPVWGGLWPNIQSGFPNPARQNHTAQSE